MTQVSPARSWVASANGHADFPLQNLPLGIFSVGGGAPVAVLPLAIMYSICRLRCRPACSMARRVKPSKP